MQTNAFEDIMLNWETEVLPTPGVPKPPNICTFLILIMKHICTQTFNQKSKIASKQLNSTKFPILWECKEHGIRTLAGKLSAVSATFRNPPFSITRIQNMGNWHTHLKLSIPTSNKCKKSVKMCQKCGTYWAIWQIKLFKNSAISCQWDATTVLSCASQHYIRCSFFIFVNTFQTYSCFLQF